jgi:chromosome segregation ATPase
MLRIYLLLFIIGTLSGIGYGAYAYYTSTQATIALLRENNVKLKSAAETMENTINTMQADAERNAVLNKQLTTQLQEAENKLGSLRKRFSEIDIAREAQTDPNGLAERINRAVDRLREELKNETTPPSAINDEPAATE